MLLCTGLVILGFCIPLPGTTRAVVAAAGWPQLNDEPTSKDWYANAWMSANKYSLLVGLGGDEDKLQTVVLYERPGNSSPRLQGVIKAMCKATKGSHLTCNLRGRKFAAMECAGGWMLAPEKLFAADAGTLQLCERVAPLFKTSNP